MTKEEYAKVCPKFGIDPESFSMEFRVGSIKYEIVGINPRARTLPIEARNMNTGTIKKFAAEVSIKKIVPTYNFDKNCVGRKFEFCGRIFTIVRIDSSVYTDPVVTDAATGVEHRFGAWIFDASKAKNICKWVD